MPVLNWDTSCFMIIIKSFSKDASCFVAQANSNYLGDTMVVAPKHSYFSEIVRLKGGDNNYCVVATIDIAGLRNNNSDFETQLRI